MLRHQFFDEAFSLEDNFFALQAKGCIQVAKTRRVFTAEFKREAVRQATQPGNTIATFSRNLGVHESVVRRWIQELTDAERPAVGGRRDDNQSRELSRLRRQVTTRRIARETIANALIRFGGHSQTDQSEAALHNAEA